MSGGQVRLAFFTTQGRNPVERVMVFIDGNNFYHACKFYLKQPPRYNFQQMCDLVVNKRPNRQLLRSYFYTVNDPQQQGLVAALSHIPRFTVVQGWIQKLKSPGVPFDPNNPNTYIPVEKGTDVNLATQLLIGAYTNSYDTAIIFSGDTDYITPIQEIKKLGKIVEVVLTPGQPTELRKEADEVFELTEEDFQQCWLGQYQTRRNTSNNVTA
jgi:uncharacterized LabA/DUF88 family protein